MVLLALPNVIEQLRSSQTSTPTTVTAPVISLPSTVVKGLFNEVTLQGRTLKNELNYNRDTWAEWSKTAGVVGDSTGLEFTANGATPVSAELLNTKFKPSTKYGILYNVVSNTFASDFGTDGSVFGYVILPKTVGNNKLVRTSIASISTNKMFLYNQLNTEPAGNKIKIKDIRLFELPTGSEIESDFNTLTADQLAVKYPYIKGDGVKSTLGVRVKSVGKNLFDKSKITKDKQVSLTTGLLETFTGRSASDFIRVSPSMQYVRTIGSDTHKVVAFYDANKNFISGLQPPASGLFTAPSNCEFVRTSWNDSQISIDVIQLEKGTVATSYEPYASTEAYTPLTLRSLPNGVRDTASVTEGIGVQRISGDKLLPTSGWGYRGKTANSNFHIISKDLGFTDIKHQQPTSTYFINYEFALDNKSFNTFVADSLTSIQNNANSKAIVKFYNATTFYLVIPISEYTQAETSAGADAYVLANLNGATLNYQLAKEITTAIPDADLIAEPNGTIIIDNAVKDTKIYGTNITIDNTALPIKALESVKKITINPDNSRTETSIDLATCTIAGDGLSFTSTALTSKDMVVYVYLYDSALSTLGSLTYSFPQNLKAVVDGNVEAIADLSEEVASLSDYTVSYLLNLEVRVTAEEARKAITQADSTATDVATLKTDFNNLLAKLKNAKLMS